MERTGLELLLQQLVPDRDTNNIVETPDRAVWYQILNGVLYIPPFKILKLNVLELNRFVESITAFCSINSEEISKLFNWNTDSLTKHQVNTIAELLNCKKELSKVKGTIAVDIETKHVHYKNNRLLAIGFASSATEVWIIDYTLFANSDFAKKIIQQLLNLDNVCYLWHGGKFDITRLLYLENLDARVDEDTMLYHFARINDVKGTHGLKELGQIYVQAPPWEDELEAIKKTYCSKNKILLEAFSYDLFPKETLFEYLALDCLVTYRLFTVFKQLGVKGTDWAYQLIIKASNTFRDIETTGVQLDLDFLEVLDKKMSVELTYLNQELSSRFLSVWQPQKYVSETGAKKEPVQFNPNSSMQLCWVLSKLTGKRVSSTNVEALQLLESDNTENNKTLQLLNKQRRLSKEYNTYVESYKKLVCEDGRIRSSFLLHGTETGRLSSKDPNVQNIPREGPIKGLYIASKDRVLLQFDYSQAEVRVLAHLSRDTFLTNIYLEDRDIHGEIARNVFGEDFKSSQRTACKAIVFGSIYGIGSTSISEQLHCSITEAKELINKVFSYMPHAKDWIQQQRDKVLAGEPCVTELGRHRNLILRDRSKLYSVQNQYVNTPVQSVASDCTLYSIVELHNWILENFVQARIVCTVHDSILLEVIDIDKVIRDVVRTAKYILENVPLQILKSCEVPFKADAEIGKKWSELEKWEKSKWCR